VIDKLRAGWLRARVTEAEEGQPFYSASPSMRGVTACTVGGTTDAVHADVVVDEIVGTSEGVAGQRFLVKRRPVVPCDRPTSVRVADDEDGWQEWTQVSDFAASGPEDRHFVLDAVAGEVSFGPAVREPDGSIRAYGAVPPKGRRIKVDVYLTGGGRLGNLASRSISILKSSIPFVSRVENRRAMAGGVDGETSRTPSCAARSPCHARPGGHDRGFRAPRPRGRPRAGPRPAVAAGEGADVGSVRVLVVPSAPARPGASASSS